MKKRLGELSFEGILGIAFLTMLAATAIAVLQFHNARQPGSQLEADITTGYNQVLASMREDARIAVKGDCAADGVSLFDAQNSLIAVYRLVKDSFYRFDKTGNGKLLINRIEKASFRLHPHLNNLLLITLLPADTMQIPFFTSFALRGVANE